MVFTNPIRTRSSNRVKHGLRITIGYSGQPDAWSAAKPEYQGAEDYALGSHLASQNRLSGEHDRAAWSSDNTRPITRKLARSGGVSASTPSGIRRSRGAAQAPETLDAIAFVEMR